MGTKRLLSDWRKIVRKLEADGWQEFDQEGSHRQFRHPTKPGKVSVSIHKGKSLKPGTVKSIERQSGISMLTE